MGNAIVSSCRGSGDTEDPPASPKVWSRFRRSIRRTPRPGAPVLQDLVLRSSPHAEEDLLRELLEHKQFLDEYVVSQVPLQDVEQWMVQKLARMNNPCNTGEISVSQSAAARRKQALYLFGLLDKLTNIPNADLAMWELSCFFGNRVNSEACRIYKILPNSNHLKYFYFRDGVLVGRDVGYTDLLASTIKLGATVRTSRVFNIHRFPPTPRELPQGGEHIMLQPIRNSARRTPYIVEFWRSVRVFSPAEEKAGSEFQVWGSVMLNFYSLYIRKKTPTDMTTILLDVVQNIFEEMVSVEHLIKKILETAQRLVDADRASLFLVDSTNMELVSNVFDLKVDPGERPTSHPNVQPGPSKDVWKKKIHVEQRQDPEVRKKILMESGESSNSGNGIPVVPGPSKDVWKKKIHVQLRQNPEMKKKILMESGESSNSANEIPVESGESSDDKNDIYVKIRQNPEVKKKILMEKGENSTSGNEIPVKPGPSKDMWKKKIHMEQRQNPEMKKKILMESGESSNSGNGIPVESGDSSDEKKDIYVKLRQNPEVKKNILMEPGESSNSGNEIPVESGESSDEKKDMYMELRQNPEVKKKILMETGESSTSGNEIPVKPGPSKDEKKDLYVELRQNPEVKKKILIETGASSTSRNKIPVKPGPSKDVWKNKIHGELRQDPEVMKKILMETGESSTSGNEIPVEPGKSSAEKKEIHVEPGETPDIEKEIRMPISRGIAGYVASSGKTLNIRDAYSDPRFNREVDEKTGYRTKNILCMPIKVKGKVIGVVQMVNKRRYQAFRREDEESFAVFSTFFGLALHHAKLYDKIKRKEQKHKIALEVLSYHNTCKENEVEELLKDKPWPIADLNNYYFNPFKFDEIKKCNAFLSMFRDLFDVSQFEEATLARFALTVKKNYRDVPYHNFDHGWSVAHSMFVMLKSDLKKRFSYKVRLAMFVACLCHDLDHRGYTNKYMSEISSPLAAMYSTSTLEHHHFNITVTILQQDNHNIFGHLSSEEYKEMLDYIRQCILATDLAVFFPNLEKMKALQEGDDFCWSNKQHRDLAMALSMTAADLSASAKPWQIQIKTVEVIFQEFYAQGDQERAAGRVPIPMMDRHKPKEQPESQIGFLSQICLPCYKVLSKILPGIQPMYLMAMRNLNIWREKAHRINKQLENNGNSTGSDVEDISPDSSFYNQEDLEEMIRRDIREGIGATRVVHVSEDSLCTVTDTTDDTIGTTDSDTDTSDTVEERDSWTDEDDVVEKGHSAIMDALKEHTSTD